MFKRLVKCGAAFAVCAACVPLAACAQDRTVYGKNYYAMGTEATYLVAAKTEKETFDDLAARVGDFLAATERSVSATVAQSYVAKFNAAEAGATVEIDQTSYSLFTLAKQIYADTDGYFNPAVWYCEDLFGFAYGISSVDLREKMPYDREGALDGFGTLPDEKYVTAFCELASHFGEVVLTEEEGRYYAVKPDFTVKVEGDDNEYSLRVDFGGIAKGWCADRVNEMMDEAGISYGYFNFGMSSMSLKKYAYNDTGDYTVSSGDPRNSGADYVTRSVQDTALSTSGDNMQYFVVDGVRYCHIIDPTTGAPIRTGVASVTVYGGSAAEADALTTALAAMGKQKAVEYINEKTTDQKVVMLVFEDGAGKIITNCPQDIEIHNKNYVVINTVVDGKIVLN
ncbi:MAG: FAD:protein FMN transferase [Clostridia bacterium]|nr:FAD:protein FMN transferase [Clostridia bacterium]